MKNGEIIEIENYSYLWQEEKEDYVLVKYDLEYAIVNKRDHSMFVICDEELEKKIINKMLECGNQIYDDINQAFMVI